MGSGVGIGGETVAKAGIVSSPVQIAINAIRVFVIGSLLFNINRNVTGLEVSVPEITRFSIAPS